MMTFRPLLLASLTPLLFGQSLILRTDNQLEGEVLGITADGGVAVQTKYSPEPINLRLDAVRELTLQDRELKDPFQSERLIMVNGDSLPGNLIAITRDSVTYNGLFENNITIPRSQVKLLSIGVDPETLIYQGPEPLSDWTGDGLESWSMGDSSSQPNSKALILQEKGTISQNVGLGEQFILKFNLLWVDEPDMRINFCEDLTEGGDRGNRYYLAINRKGVQIRRQMGKSGGQNGLVAIRRPEAFDDKYVAVELRYNGTVGKMELYLDEKLAREVRVSIKPPPGHGISIVQSANDRALSELSDLQIDSWDAISLSALAYNERERKTDSLVTSGGAQFSGELLEMRFPDPPEPRETPAEDDAKSEEEAETESDATEVQSAPKLTEASFILKSPLSEDDIAVTYDKARILLFKNQETLKDDEKPEKELPLYEIETLNNGRLSADAVSMDDQFLTITHPVLGELRLSKDSVISLTTLHLAP